MAVEFFGPANTTSSPDTPPSSRAISPRISFSHDLCQYDVVPIEPPSSLSASANFNFSNGGHLPHPPSSADELFSNGVLLPLRSKPTSQNPPPPPPPLPPADDAITEELQKQSMKSSSSATSFWKFKRSRSFNCGNIYGGTLCPLLLSRSKSTGSNSSSKRSLVPKEDHRNPATASAGNINRNRNLSSPSYNGYQKPPLKKSFSSNVPAGATVSPVLNVSSGNLFGLGSIFNSIGKSDKINKKKLVN